MGLSESFGSFRVEPGSCADRSGAAARVKPASLRHGQGTENRWLSLSAPPRKPGRGRVSQVEPTELRAAGVYADARRQQAPGNQGRPAAHSPRTPARTLAALEILYWKV